MDVGVQNILNAKKEMVSISENRGVIVVKKNE